MQTWIIFIHDWKKGLACSKPSANELKFRTTKKICTKLTLTIYLFIQKNAWYVSVSENYDIDLTLQEAFLDQSWTEKRTIRKGENLDRVDWNESNYSKIDVQINLGLHHNKTKSSIAMLACLYICLVSDCMPSFLLLLCVESNHKINYVQFYLECFAFYVDSYQIKTIKSYVSSTLLQRIYLGGCVENCKWIKVV